MLFCVFSNIIMVPAPDVSIIVHKYRWTMPDITETYFCARFD